MNHLLKPHPVWIEGQDRVGPIRPDDLHQYPSVVQRNHAVNLHRMSAEPGGQAVAFPLRSFEAQQVVGRREPEDPVTILGDRVNRKIQVLEFGRRPPQHRRIAGNPFGAGNPEGPVSSSAKTSKMLPDKTPARVMGYFRPATTRNREAPSSTHRLPSAPRQPRSESPAPVCTTDIREPDQLTRTRLPLRDTAWTINSPRTPGSGKSKPVNPEVVACFFQPFPARRCREQPRETALAGDPGFLPGTWNHLAKRGNTGGLSGLDLSPRR